MNKTTILAAASAAALLSSVPVFAQANQQGGGKSRTGKEGCAEDRSRDARRAPGFLAGTHHLF